MPTDATNFTRADFDAALEEQGWVLVESEYCGAQKYVNDWPDRGIVLVFQCRKEHEWAEANGWSYSITGCADEIIAAIEAVVPEGVSPPFIQDEFGQTLYAILY